MAIKVNMESLKSALSGGPLNIRQLAEKLGRSSPWDLESDLKDMETGFRAMVSIGNMDYVPFTVFPAREREAYGFKDIVPEVKGENPQRKRRKTRNPEAKEQRQYWPLVGWGDIQRTEVGETYDGRWDEVVTYLDETLGAEFAEWLAERGYSADFDIRGTRGGVSIRLSVPESPDTSDIVPDLALSPVT